MVECTYLSATTGELGEGLLHVQRPMVLALIGGGNGQRWYVLVTCCSSCCEVWPSCDEAGATAKCRVSNKNANLTNGREKRVEKAADLDMWLKEILVGLELEYIAVSSPHRWNLILSNCYQSI